MWERIETRYRGLKFGRSQYFQALVEWDLRNLPEIHAHKADGKWHLYPESEAHPAGKELLKAAEDPSPGSAPAFKARRTRR
jgi:hypothetical protein